MLAEFSIGLQMKNSGHLADTYLKIISTSTIYLKIVYRVLKYGKCEVQTDKLKKLTLP